MIELLAACLITIQTYEKISGSSAQIVGIQQASQCKPVEAKIEDGKEYKAIKRFLAKRVSPLEDASRDFVEVSKTCKADPYLLVAIAGKESGLGHHECASYNVFGYGNPCYGFSSYREAIQRVCRTIMEGRAYARFRSTKQIEDLAPVYNKPTGYEDWVKDVKWFMEKIKQEEI